MADLTVVYGGMLEEAVGEGRGISAAMLDRAFAALPGAYAALQRKREGGEVGFLDTPADQTFLPELQEVSGRFRDRFENLLVLGIGGSALGATALVRALTPPFHPKDGANRVLCLDNIDPDWFGAALEHFPLEKTGFAVVSKSGTTPEPLSQYLVVRERLREQLPTSWRDHLVFVTDAARGPLRDEAARTGAPSFVIPGNVGGRFSVFTPVGLFPAACAGIDVTALKEGAKTAVERAGIEHIPDNPALLLAGLLVTADRELGQRNHVLMPYRQALWEVAFWFRQLWAESLGKTPEVGPTPIAALGATDQHSQMQLYMEGPRDKVILFLEVEESNQVVPVPAEAPEGLSHLGGKSLAQLLDAELVGSRAALLEAGRTVITLRMPRIAEREMGELLQTFMIATAVAGELYGIDAFDQPGVEAGKVNAAALLGKEDLADRARLLRETSRRIEAHRTSGGGANGGGSRQGR